MRAPFACLCALLLSVGLPAADDHPGSASLTVYNQNFAVVRQNVPLDLKAGVNHVAFSDITMHVEPDSVVLRDAHGGTIRILEQNYRNDPISAALLLSLNEGKVLDFVRTDAQGHETTVRGRVIRSGYVPHYEAYQQYGQQYAQAQSSIAYGGSGEPIIEVDGKLQFTLPGQPRFPALGDDTILKPTLDWQLQSDNNEHADAELSYITSGMSWHADYNITAPQTGDVVDMVGWITLDNQSGKTFDNAKIKLMAGDVSKIAPARPMDRFYGSAGAALGGIQPPVTEKTFDEYHLYTLERPSTLRDREVKQVEFLRASGVRTNRIYVYDGVKIGQQFNGWGLESIRENASYGTESNKEVWVMLEFKNSKENNLGMPLPAGRARVYRRDQNGPMEFTGEDKIDHTPSNETVRLYNGNAFDVVGERRRTYFRTNSSERWADESFEIALRNHKTTPVEVRVVEHLYRWTSWEISQKSQEFQKTDAQTIEFRLQLPPDVEKKVTYMVHYTW